MIIPFLLESTSSIPFCIQIVIQVFPFELHQPIVTVFYLRLMQFCIFIVGSYGLNPRADPYWHFEHLHIDILVIENGQSDRRAPFESEQLVFRNFDKAFLLSLCSWLDLPALSKGPIVVFDFVVDGWLC